MIKVSYNEMTDRLRMITPNQSVVLDNPVNVQVNAEEDLYFEYKLADQVYLCVFHSDKGWELEVSNLVAYKHVEGEANWASATICLPEEEVMATLRTITKKFAMFSNVKGISMAAFKMVIKRCTIRGGNSSTLVRSVHPGLLDEITSSIA
jgi:hypothetical protein